MEYREFSEEEEKWIRSFQRVMKKAPSSLFFFIASGTPIVFTTDENGNRYVSSNKSMDQDAPSVLIITDMDCDGGDF